MTVGVVIAAAGTGTRMGRKENKVLLPLGGRSVLSHSLACFDSIDEVSQVVVVTNAQDQEAITELVARDVVHKQAKVVLGGAERQDSVYLGLKALPQDTKWVMIHDGARPFVTKELVMRALAACREHLAVGVAVRVKDTIKQVRDGLVIDTPDRSQLWAMQTPQVFSFPLILQAHEWAKSEGVLATDDCALIEAMGSPVHVVEGDYANIKITTPEDLPKPRESRIGFGYDVHRLVTGRRLILGGVEIPYEKGLLGHSDADVVTHAVMDALLGAMGLGDIGEHFPDTDPKYEGISSILLLDEVVSIMGQKQLELQNLDITIMAQKPKLATWKRPIKNTLAQKLFVPETAINIKATTTEGLGFVGREEGIAVQVVALLVDLR
ncbi:MAG: 2-C-methyl-D-erythritol 4-phosphate cytidylyltransferase [Firmicutes bacterium]|nr:2-C-methyl-D-erythritol 4-phosphate cytidylyltransferase [Bacillota bacterium]